VINIDGRQNDATVITTRPILTVSNLNTELFRINPLGNTLTTVTATTGVAEICAQWTVSDDTGSIVRIANGFTTDGLFAPVFLFQTSANVDAGKSACYFYTYINTASDTANTVPICTFNAANSNSTAIVNRPLYEFRNNGTGVLKINPNGDVLQTVKAQTGAAELLHKWQIGDNATAYIQFQNGSTVDGIFLPRMVSYNFNAGATGYGMAFTHYIAAADDSGTAPVTIYDVRRSTEAAITSRPSYEWRNFGVAMLTLSQVYADFHDVEVRNIKGSSTMTEIEGWQINKRTGHLHGGNTVNSEFGTGLLAPKTLGWYGTEAPISAMYGNGGICSGANGTFNNSDGVMGYKCLVNTRCDREIKLAAKARVDRQSASRFFVVLKNSTTQITSGTTVPIGAAEGGIAIGWTESDTTYHVWSNDGATSTTDVDTNVTIPAWNNDAEQLELSVDTAGTTWTWRILSTNGTTVLGTGTITTDIPTTAHNLHFHIHGEITDATASTFLIWAVDLESKK
jgi:hypothetical protein